MQITKRHLTFLEEAKTAFESKVRCETYRNEDDTLIALRYGADRDCIKIHEFGEEIGFFAQMMDKAPKLIVPSEREELRWFVGEMENQLRINEGKGGWLDSNTNRLRSELHRNFSKMNSASDKDEIIRRCANIANYAMMIADKERDPWDRPI